MTTVESGITPSAVVFEVRRAEPSRSSFRLALIRFSQNRVAVAAGVVVLVFVLVGLAAPILATTDPYSGDLSARLQSPSPAHLLGTDELGRDILTRIIFGASTSLRIQAGAIGLGLLSGVTLGTLAGYYGGWIDETTMRSIDMLMAFPGVFLALAVVAALGPGTLNMTLAVGISGVPGYARLMRASTMSERERDYVLASRALGGRAGWILRKHILPNCATPLIVFTTLHLSTVLLTASGLSYLGLGVQPPDPEWGAMLSASRTYLLTAPHAAILPGLAIMVVSFAFNMLGDGLRDAADPRLRA